MLQIQLPDGSLVDYPDDATAMDVATKIGARLASAVVAAKIGDRVVDATRPLREFAASPIPLRLLTDRDAESLNVLRHSCAHIMARAVMRLYGGVSLAFGPTIANGFYYDFELNRKLNLKVRVIRLKGFPNAFLRAGCMKTIDHPWNGKIGPGFQSL